ncbi:hypothetical protein H9Y04_17055 [Streptomyces sp. TRM66268-LWL]|uniref:Alpha/beta hydrolase n=1 Tax=Streptomyces polyasparticus TaxID=2767826 RepID=A0ABR7SFJ2_9ACTN|nr:hypothetical protein [Streptomyces polyasparticus]MBC9714271.1 hypothetical protein [Streptomyces polyasparticus]
MTVSRRTASLCTALLLATGLLAGCGGDDEPSAKATGPAPESSPAPRPTDFGCLTEGGDPVETKQGSVAFKNAEGGVTYGYSAGTGTTGVVLAHQRGGDVCEWKPYADRLVEAGHQVLAVNSQDKDVAEIHGAVELLRSKGARKLVLMGASKGGTAVLTAAAELDPQPDVVVALSAPESYGTMDASAAVPQLTSAALFMAGVDDFSFAQAAEYLHKGAVKAKEKHLVVDPGGAYHGVSLFDHEKNWTTVQKFIAEHAK